MEPPAFGVSVLFRKEPEADGDADATGAAVRAYDGFDGNLIHIEEEVLNGGLVFHGSVLVMGFACCSGFA